MNNIIPFGGRVLVEVDQADFKNIGNKIYTGNIVKMSSLLDVSPESFERLINPKDIQFALYYNAIVNLSIGTTVRFNFEEKVIDKIGDNLYNVPIELIRSYEEKNNG